MDNFLEKSKTLFVLQDTLLTAGATITATGAETDRYATYTDPDGEFTTKVIYNQADYIVIMDGAVANTETLSLKVYLQTSDVSGFGSDVNYVATDGTLKTSTTGAASAEYAFTGVTATAVTFDDVVDLKAILNSSKRYIRPYITATFSNSGTDTVGVAIALVAGGADANPIDTVDIKCVVGQ